ncbi:MAG: WYL domain-containing protein [Spirochaetales bacterium]|nr:WYL domain-containing protein [Spirochaetales bacterium]
MSQTERIFYILEKLRRENRITTGATAKRFEVSSRTVKRDLEYIRDRLDYDLLWSGGEKHYYLSSRDLEKIRLKGEEELLFYSLAMGFCRNRKLMPLLSQSIEDHLAQILPPEYRELANHISYGLFDHSEPPSRFFSCILKGISERKSLDMVYSSLKGSHSERRVDPLHVKNWNGQWYLAAWCHLRKEIRLFHLNRIESLELSRVSFEPPLDGVELEKRMNSGFGIMTELNRDGAGRDVTIRFSGKAALLTEGLVWHPSQSVYYNKEEGRREFSFPVSSYEELLNRVFSYREEAEVLAPDELRELWKEKIRKMAANYL